LDHGRRASGVPGTRQSLTAAELLPGLAKTRLQHILILATTLRVRLEFGRVAVVREPD